MGRKREVFSGKESCGRFWDGQDAGGKDQFGIVFALKIGQENIQWKTGGVYAHFV
jgi:hypothetical protein